ncbi:MAG: OTU domain-containing protein, partial [Gammaproteobacteria bacterium]
MYYKELLALVNNKQLELYWILAPQRSFSTAIAIALSQADTIHQLLSEPFYYNDLENRPYDVDCEKANQEKFERGCNSLLTAYKKYAKPEQQAPVRLLFKDMVGYLDVQSFQRIAQLAHRILFLVRDPLQQSFSLLERFANDRFAETGRDYLSKEQLIALCRAFQQKSTFESEVLVNRSVLNDAFLANPQQKMEQLIIDFEKNSQAIWKNLNTYIQQAQSHPLWREITMVIDSNAIINWPEIALPQICKRWGEVAFTEAMVNKWEKSTGNDFFSCITRHWDPEMARSNAWNGPARQSSGFFKRAPLKLSVKGFPAQIKEVIQEVQDQYNQLAIGIEPLLTDERQMAVDKDPVKEMSSLLDVPADGSCLFYAVALGVLFLSLEDEQAFGEACERLFGASSLSVEEQTTLRTYLQTHQMLGFPLLKGYTSLESEVRRLINKVWRNKVVNYMATLKDTLGESSSYYQALAAEADDRGMTIEAYLSNMRSPDVWGGEPEILAMCHYLGHSIEVYEDRGSKMISRHVLPGYEGALPLRVLYCSPVGGSVKNHYQLLLQPLGPEVVPSSVSGANISQPLIPEVVSPSVPKDSASLPIHRLVLDEGLCLSPTLAKVSELWQSSQGEAGLRVHVISEYMASLKQIHADGSLFKSLVKAIIAAIRQSGSNYEGPLLLWVDQWTAPLGFALAKAWRQDFQGGKPSADKEVYVSVVDSVASAGSAMVFPSQELSEGAELFIDALHHMARLIAERSGCGYQVQRL